MADTPPSAGIAAVDAALSAWRQGDCVLGDHWFASRFDIGRPLSTAAKEAAREGVDLAETLVRGLVVVTQTCDIVRSCADRPFIEVCPLVEVDDSRLQDIAHARRPAYALVPALAGQRLVADIDRTMTLEKPVVAKWNRTPGHNSDAEGRAFAQALARKRVRFAFPDDFTALAKKLHDRLAAKHDKNTDEGRSLQDLREIRVQASPSWDANPVTLDFWFIRYDRDIAEGRGWEDLLIEWLNLVPKAGRFNEVNGEVVTLGDLTAADYVGSDPLDLDHLSSRRP